jgi:large subunit ribosomal protein L7/L12
MSEETTEATETVELTAELEDIFTKLNALPLGEASKLVKAMEERWGVSAAGGGGVMMAAPTDGDGPVAAEKTSFDVLLKEQGGNKIQVIKAVREITGLGLKEAKALVDGVPGTPGKLKEGVSKEEAEEVKTKIEEVGGVCEIK